MTASSLLPPVASATRKPDSDEPINDLAPGQQGESAVTVSRIIREIYLQGIALSRGDAAAGASALTRFTKLCQLAQMEADKMGEHGANSDALESQLELLSSMFA